MGFEVVGSGDRWNLSNLAGLDEYMPEGARGRVTLKFSSLTAVDFVDQVFDELNQAGVSDLEVDAHGNTLTIGFRKGFAWLPVIAAILLASIVLVILLVSWQFAVESPILFSLTLIAGIAILVVAGLVAKKRGLI